MATEESELMAAIVKAAAPLLKDAGFRKRRHAFNRTTDDGLVHVVHFWMAPKEPPAWTEVPGLRERRYGGFRLDFGVRVPDITRMGVPRSEWVKPADCDLRATHHWLETGRHEDAWWDLRDPDSERAALEALTTHGLPWLDRFPDSEAVLREFDEHGPTGIGMSRAGALDISQVHEAMGDQAGARRVLEAYVSRPHLQSHTGYLKTFLEKSGHADLVDRVRAESTPEPD
jgi:hypothetical protein